MKYCPWGGYWTVGEECHSPEVIAIVLILLILIAIFGFIFWLVSSKYKSWRDKRDKAFMKELERRVDDDG